jgi:AraC-like DNA-binding protein
MSDYFKYLTQSPEDKSWGFFLTVAGYAKVAPRATYPPAGHPSGYNFNWTKGRVLQEYQINYITEGEGIMETLVGSYPVKEGSILLIQPNMWHRYQPLKEKGWTEHYIGFNGEFASNIIKNMELFQDSPILQIGFQEKIIQDFHYIFNIVKSEKPGYQQICAGLAIYILGQIVSLKKNENIRSSKMESIIQKACMHIRDNIYKNVNIEEIAANFNVDYSLFRKTFKKYTGLSPAQYHLSLRIQQAIYLLTNTDLSIKEISFNLGFGSVFYFSKLFKEKVNATPSNYRNNSMGKG